MWQNFASIFSTLIGANLTLGGISAALALGAANFWQETRHEKWLMTCALAVGTVISLIVTSAITILLFAVGMLDQGQAGMAMTAACLGGSILLSIIAFILVGDRE